MMELQAEADGDQPRQRTTPSVDQSSSDPSKTSVPASAHAAQTDVRMELSRPIFRSCWVLALMVHSVCAAFYILIAMLYHYLLSTGLIWTVVLYSLSIDMSQYPLVTAVRAILAAAHIFEILRMLLVSIRHKQLIFESPRVMTKPGAVGSVPAPRSRWRSSRAYKVLDRAITKASQRWSIFGREPAFADLRMALRVTLDIALLSYQCNRMSWYLSRMWLQRLYVSMLVINCWSDPLIGFMIHRTKSSRKLLKARALVDMTLDFMSVIVIPCVLLHTYYVLYNPLRSDFAREFYYDDEPLLRFLNEFKLLLVYSGIDLLQRFLLGSDLLICGQTMKSLLRPATRSSASPQKIKSMIKRDFANSDAQLDDVGSTKTKSAHGKPRHAIRVAKVVTKFLHGIFILWGLIVACAQLYAEVRPMSEDCVIVVRPWFRPKPGCALVELSGAGIPTGQEIPDAIADRLAAFDEEAVSYLILSHHAALHVPNHLKNLRNLVGLKMKNVTLIEWSENAALTQTHHPRARFVFLVQFNATSIPPGLLSSDFPELLMDIEICVSTLSDVPSNLPSLWPPGTWLFIDHSNFTTIPDALVNMKVTFLSLSFNQISTVPAGLFMNPWLTLIGLSGNPISAIPEVPAQNLTTLDLIALDGTNVSSLPMWMDNAFLTSTSVYFGNTPLCNNASSSIQAVRSRFHRPVCHLQDDCRRLFQLA